MPVLPLGIVIEVESAMEFLVRAPVAPLISMRCVAIPPPKGIGTEALVPKVNTWPVRRLLTRASYWRPTPVPLARVAREKRPVALSPV